jgi:siroheme synthase
VRDLIESGVDAGTPCVVVSNAGRISQEIRYLSVAALGYASGIAAPAILIVGEVARVSDSSQELEAQLLPELQAEREVSIGAGLAAN